MREEAKEFIEKFNIHCNNCGSDLIDVYSTLSEKLIFQCNFCGTVEEKQQ